MLRGRIDDQRRSGVGSDASAGPATGPDLVAGQVQRPAAEGDRVAGLIVKIADRRGVLARLVDRRVSVKRRVIQRQQAVGAVEGHSGIRVNRDRRRDEPAGSRLQCRAVLKLDIHRAERISAANQRAGVFYRIVEVELHGPVEGGGRTVGDGNGLVGADIAVERECSSVHRERLQRHIRIDRVRAAGDDDVQQVLKGPVERARAGAEGQIVGLGVEMSRSVQRLEGLVGPELDGAVFGDCQRSGRNRVFGIQRDEAFINVQTSGEGVRAAEDQRSFAGLGQGPSPARFTDVTGDLQREVVVRHVQRIDGLGWNVVLHLGIHRDHRQFRVAHERHWTGDLDAGTDQCHRDLAVVFEPVVHLHFREAGNGEFPLHFDVIGDLDALRAAVPGIVVLVLPLAITLVVVNLQRHPAHDHPGGIRRVAGNGERPGAQPAASGLVGVLDDQDAPGHFQAAGEIILPIVHDHKAAAGGNEKAAVPGDLVFDIHLGIRGQTVLHAGAEQRDRRGCDIVLVQQFEFEHQVVAVGGIAEDEIRRHNVAAAVVVAQDQAVHNQHIGPIIAFFTEPCAVLAYGYAAPQRDLGGDVRRIERHGVPVWTTDVDGLGGVEHLVIVIQSARHGQRAAVQMDIAHAEGVARRIFPRVGIKAIEHQQTVVESNVARETIHELRYENRQRAGAVLGQTAGPGDRAVDVRIAVAADLQVAVQGDRLDVVRRGAGQRDRSRIGEHGQPADRSGQVRRQIQQRALRRIVHDRAGRQGILAEDQPPTA